jgi:hypothetical protein
MRQDGQRWPATSSVARVLGAIHRVSGNRGPNRL